MRGEGGERLGRGGLNCFACFWPEVGAGEGGVGEGGGVIGLRASGQRDGGGGGLEGGEVLIASATTAEL